MNSPSDYSESHLPSNYSPKFGKAKSPVRQPLKTAKSARTIELVKSRSSKQNTTPLKGPALSQKKIETQNYPVAGNTMQTAVSLTGDLVCFGAQVTNEDQIFPQNYLNDFAKKAKLKKEMHKKGKTGSEKTTLVGTRDYID